MGSEPIRETEPGSVTRVIRDAAMRGEADRYLAATLAPRASRPGLLALAAFVADLGRIAPSVSEPMLGVIRLQWWRDALEAGGTATATGYPVADAWRAALGDNAPVREAALALIEARERDLDATPFASEEALLAHLDATEGRAFGLALSLLGATDAPASPLARAAGRAYGLSRRWGGGNWVGSRWADDGDRLASSRDLATSALAEARSLRAALPIRVRRQDLAASSGLPR